MASDSGVLRIAGELTIYRAMEWKGPLLAQLRPGACVEFDLSGVTDIDCAGIQLLMLAKKTAVQRECALRMAGHSPPVAEAFEMLNLAGYFGDPVIVAPAS